MREVAKKMCLKLDKYWDELKNTFHEAVILDPNNKLASKTESSCDYFRHHLKRTYGVFTEDDNPLEEYLSSPIENVDILAYWKAKSKDQQWIPLVKMAHDYLVIQATSVPSEQMFSVAKFTINPTRNRLNPDKVRASLCLKTWFAAGLIEEDFMKDNDLINE
ncbi:unnamed protein product [Rhizophagus irregularis]|nr:unnamed protein product [Rhizophagus irregularis]CAB5383279.1 unnamed protein product [Rhizophagus irregularis]